MAGELKNWEIEEGERWGENSERASVRIGVGRKA
jgi:hypothetical protein